jgi:hypothetical protein
MSWVSFADLQRHHCRWPCWSNGAPVPPPDAPAYCGKKPVPGSSYCEVHTARSAGAPHVRRRVDVVEERDLQVA